VAVYREGQGIGFAIPVRQVLEAMAHLFTPEISHGLWFGARLKPQADGLRVVAVQEGSPAFQAGVRSGQRMLAVNGAEPRSLIDFNEALCRQPDREARLRVEENGKATTLAVRMLTFDDLVQHKLGMVVVPLSPSNEAGFQRAGYQGLYITSVEENGPAARAGLKEGSVITGLGDQPAVDLLHLAQLLANRNPGERVALRVVETRRVGGGVMRFERVMLATLR
jgi:S1-C subfamily serine protease